MAHDSESKDGSDLNKVKIPQARRNDGFLAKPDNLYVKFRGVECCKDKSGLRSLFDQLLSSFLKGLCVKKNPFRPLPPRIGVGQEVDLFKLFWIVRRNGGYESMSENGLWGSVAEECGFENKLVTPLKLVYVAYLNDFDRWFSQGGDVKIGMVQSLDSLVRELEEYRETKATNGREFVEFGDDKKGKSVVLGEKNKEGALEVDEDGGGTNLDLAKPSDDEQFSEEMEISLLGVVKKVDFSSISDDNDESFSVEDDKRTEDVVDFPSMDEENDESFSEKDEGSIDVTINNVVNDVLGLTSKDDGTIFSSHKDNDTVTFGKSFVDNDVSSQKRKRGEESFSFSEMLDWIADIARDPHEKLPNRSKGKNSRGNELQKKVLLARKALFAKRNVGSGNEASRSQKKSHRMRPSMYEDEKLPDPVSSRNRRQKPKVRDDSETTENRNPGSVNVGPLYQAQVPEWTGVVSESDPKWLGTRVWPPPDQDQDHEPDPPEPVGLGRPLSCECMHPGSAECVRFHIAENRIQIKMEIGPLFFEWRFSHMGEEASLSWEPEEEETVKRLVVRARREFTHSRRSRQEIMGRFWRRAAAELPEKTKENVVCYYFNVFVLRRRSYQNRVMPGEIDSDEDVQELGSVGGKFGYERVHGLPQVCTENKQCTEFEA